MSKPQSDQDQQVFAMRHSLAHIMATAIQELYPEAKFGVGPVVENGFYYDVDLPKPIGVEDLGAIEGKMREVVKADYPFEQSTMKLEEALKYFGDKGQAYKVDLLGDLKEHGTTVAKEIDRSQMGVGEGVKVDDVGIYTDGPFTDLCRGPHVASTGQVGAFKLMRVSGAYWRGDEKNAQMQRIYGVGFTTKPELLAHLDMLEEAAKRDHRKLGKELDLFVFSDLVGPGLPLFTPRGTLIREQINAFVQELRETIGGGYQAVTIPHITKKDLYIKSGHWKKFSEELFKIKTREGHEFAMKPMNCPHHTQIYASQPRSYRDLPIRYRETTMVYRDEQSGELSGLSRVRSITQDDAHVFCRTTQIESELGKIWDIVQAFNAKFGIELKVRFSRHDPDKMDEYLGTAETWERTERQMKAVIEARGVEYMDGLGEAAFYGPKIDFMGRDVFGREFQAATIQIDMGQPEGFDLVVTNEAGERERIVMLHAAIAGSLERFMVLLLEQTAGAFPAWLAPEQVRLAPINETPEILEYTEQLRRDFAAKGLRVGIDAGAESVGKKIRAAGLAKVPYTVVVGEKERESGRISPRLRRGHGEFEGEIGVVEFAEAVAAEAAERAAASRL
ncbi:MAG TPA: threonine--tRNA ligase [Candidatus Saccharimonadia bacterium]|nr:threonine--tRNA ligase [Candidatus Saccharimonadia bacterium]